MDFKDQIKQFADRVLKLKDSILTEEAAKNAFVMPFIQCLGYDVFNPLEIVPEFVADLGIKIGEKVDYGIMKDGQPIILIECKHHSQNLDPHNSQLFRYFNTTKAKFGLLTNGIEYRFYTDLVEPNKMDEKPFFSFLVTEIKDQQIEELKKFHKTYYNQETIVNVASELKFSGEIKAIFHSEINNPSPEFVRLFAKQVYPGQVTQKVLEQFTQITKKSISQYLNDQITDRLKSALVQEQKAVESQQVTIVSQPENDTPKIVTTEEELEGYQIIRSILRKTIGVERIFYRDAQSYFSIILDDSNRKPICRLYFNGLKKYIGIFSAAKTEEKKELKTLDDLFAMTDALIISANNYILEKASAN
jgi:hypothetical protein